MYYKYKSSSQDQNSTRITLQDFQLMKNGQDAIIKNKKSIKKKCNT